MKPKRILIVGGSGHIGQAVVKALDPRHEIIIAGKSQGDFTVDIAHLESIQQLYSKVGPLDAVVAAVGIVKFIELPHMTMHDLDLGFENKLKGQIALVLEGRKYVNDGGSFTLTSGILSEDPIPSGMSAAIVNGAI